MAAQGHVVTITNLTRGNVGVPGLPGVIIAPLGSATVTISTNTLEQSGLQTAADSGLITYVVADDSDVPDAMQIPTTADLAAGIVDHAPTHETGGGDVLTDIPAAATLAGGAITITNTVAWLPTVDEKAGLAANTPTAINAVITQGEFDAHAARHNAAGLDPLTTIAGTVTVGAGPATILGHWPDRVIYVDASAGNDTYVGTEKEPLATIQAGITAAAALAPSIAAPVMVAIHADTYTEDVTIHGDIDFSGLILWAVGGKVMIEAATTCALIISSATDASVALYRAAGADPTPLTGDTALLVAGANPATEITLHNLIVGATGSVVVDAQVLGVGPGVAFGTTAITFLECGVNGDLVTENVVNVQVANGCVIGQDLVFWNTNQLNFLRSNIVRNVTGTWDTAQDVPSVVTNLGLINGYGGFIGGNLAFDGGATATDGVNDPGNGMMRGLHIVGNLDIDDEASFFMENGYIGGSSDIEGDAVLRLTDVHHQGAMVLVNAGGAVACAMNGGTLIGALTDAAPRLGVVNNVSGATTIGGVATRTLGNLPVFTRALAIPFGDASTGALSIVVPFAAALPANAMPLGGRIHVTTNYDDLGGTITACTAQIGTTANPDLFIDAGNDILAGTGDLAAAGDAFDGTTAPYPYGAVTPVVTITAIGANLSTLTAGAITAYLYYAIPQV